MHWLLDNIKFQFSQIETFENGQGQLQLYYSISTNFPVQSKVQTSKQTNKQINKQKQKKMKQTNKTNTNKNNPSAKAHQQTKTWASRAPLATQNRGTKQEYNEKLAPPHIISKFERNVCDINQVVWRKMPTSYLYYLPPLISSEAKRSFTTNSDLSVEIKDKH